MYSFIRNTSVTGGLLAVMFLPTLPAMALDAGMFLQAPASFLLGDMPSSTKEESGHGRPPSYEGSVSGTGVQPLKSRLLTLHALLGAVRTREDIRSEDENIITSDDMSSVEIAKVSDMSATLALSSPKLTKVTVYYSPASPVMVSDKTASASPWKFWNSKQVTLRGLSPDTVYHYKVVAVTTLGTTTSAEASFKTVAR